MPGYTSFDQVRVKCVVELQGKEHAMRLKKALLNKGYPLVWNVNDEPPAGSSDGFFQHATA